MTDLTPIESYIIDLDDATKDLVASQVSNDGFSKTLKYYMKLLDCTRTLSNGMRIMQTIGYPYSRAISIVVLLISGSCELVDGIKEELYEFIVNRHQNNLDYEKSNPPVWYDEKKKWSSNRRNKSSKEPKEKPAKVSKAERQLAKKVAKINALSFKLSIK